MSSTRWSCWLRYGHKSSDSFFVGVVNPDTGKLNNTDRSYVPLWSPVNGKIFNIKSNADKWKLNGNNDNNYAFPLSFPVKHSTGADFCQLFYLFRCDLMISSRSEILWDDLCKAYQSACKHKKKKHTVIEFSQHREVHLRQLHYELLTDTYHIRPSTCFIIRDPVQREIFAADFRDRIVHHLIYSYLAPVYEKYFIYDSYSCRIGKGTHLGIQRVKRFMRAASENFTKEAWVLKLDIKGFFMSIDKKILWDIIYKDNVGCCPNWLLKLIHQVIFHDPTKICIIKGHTSDRIGLPADKSLFYSGKDRGLAIGNLTSQLFANVYLHHLDKYIKYQLGFRWYGRYVDDFTLIHYDKQKLLDAISLIRSFLSDQLHITLHPKKIYLQPIQNGMLFLGSCIKPYRSYLRKRTIGKWYHKVQLLNQTRDRDQILSVMNSYLGMCQHHKSYRLCQKLWKQCASHIHTTFIPKSDYSKIMSKTSRYLYY